MYRKPRPAGHFAARIDISNGHGCSGTCATLITVHHDLLWYLPQHEVSILSLLTAQYDSGPAATQPTPVLYNFAVRWRLRSRLLVLVVFIGAVVQAEPVAQLRPTGYVNDFAHVLDSSTASQLEELCAQIDDKAHAQIAVVTINSLDGSDI